MTCLNIFGCSPAIVSRHCYSEITWSSSFTFVQKGRGNVCQSNVSRRTAGKDGMVTQLKADQKSFKAVYKETYYLQPPVTEWKEIVWSRESGDLPCKVFFASENKIQEPISSTLPLWSLLKSAFIFLSSWSGRPSTQEKSLAMSC